MKMMTCVILKVQWIAKVYEKHVKLYVTETFFQKDKVLHQIYTLHVIHLKRGKKC